MNVSGLVKANVQVIGLAAGTTVGFEVTVALSGDLNGDCVVDVADVMLVATCWHEAGDCLAYDFDADGKVTVADIMTVVAHWGEVLAVTE